MFGPPVEDAAADNTDRRRLQEQTKHHHSGSAAAEQRGVNESICMVRRRKTEGPLIWCVLRKPCRCRLQLVCGRSVGGSEVSDSDERGQRFTDGGAANNV